MLVLKDIIKDYKVGDEVTHALKGVSISFEEKGITSILGPSGCGKTTLLNIIGGLDSYTSGDLLIDNKSTKDFKDKDWDGYRNQHVGFIFQSYNLIPHLSILDNITIALSLSGVDSKTRKEMAKKALKEVGLEEKMNKKPNQLSGGQMQRVAIARAIVNNPSIILADEPTGALDSVTSRQVLDILKEISKEHLVIMVTHNKDLAEEYSDRILQIKDGLIISDSKEEKIEIKDEEVMVNRKTKMSFIEALKSSFKNLLSKKGRTILTSIAGSIGIIGVALVLAISNGMTNFINYMQRDALAGFPIQVTQRVVTDYELGEPEGEEYSDEDIFYVAEDDITITYHTNKIDQDYVDYLGELDSKLYDLISYSYSIPKNLIGIKDDTNEYFMVDTSSRTTLLGTSSSYFNEMNDNEDFILSQYDLLYGEYPSTPYQLMIVVDSYNQIDQSVLDAFGISLGSSFSSSDLLNRKFKLILNDEYYTKMSDTLFVPSTDYESLYNNENAIELAISGILRIKEEAQSEVLNEGINYSSSLTKIILEDCLTSEIVLSQKENPETNVLTSLPFSGSLTYESVMLLLGGDENPIGISIYPTDFENKDAICRYLDQYNDGKEDKDKIIYTDLSESIGSMINQIVSTISIVLVAFAAVSLVVSTVMIGVITYVSVVERTKEIGIMRALGARKVDISRIFNAETFIIGLASGLIGVIFTYIVSIPLSIIITNLANYSFTVLLNPLNAILLVLVSIILTLIGGFIPSKLAAKRDPVVALRSE